MAKAGYEDVQRCEPGHPDAFYMLGVISVAQCDPKRGIALIQEALANKPNFPMAWNNLGLALIEVGRVGEAVDAFEQAAGMRPEDHEVHLNLASALHRVLVWMTYLNDVERGGETEFPHFGLRVRPVKGRTLIWPPNGPTPTAVASSRQGLSTSSPAGCISPDDDRRARGSFARPSYVDGHATSSKRTD